MNYLEPTPTPAAAWLKPSVEEQGLQRYVATIRERKWLILGTVLLTTLAAIAYVVVTNKAYKAEATLLVTPVPSDDPTLSALPLIRQSSDPTRDVETAARLVSSPNVAKAVKTDLRDSRTTSQILDDVQVEPVAQSNVVSVSAEGRTPAKAQTLANSFTRQAVQQRTNDFHAQLDEQINNLRSRLNSLPAAERNTADPNSVGAQLAHLETLRGGPDPTLRVESLADRPSSPVRPKPKLSIAAGIIAGLVLGIGGAFALQVLDPRLRREEQLRGLYGLPILARIPKDSKAHAAGALAPEQLSPGTIEAYRTLRATLAASRAGAGNVSTSILVTSPSASEGKTTTAINLASSLALAGNKVVLIEADLRRPAVGRALGVEPRHGTGSVLLETVELRDALTTTTAYGDYLQLLLADYSGGATGWMADRLFLPAARKLVDEAKQLADFVIVDSPPLSEVIDALPLAQQVDELVVVVRLGKSRLAKLRQLAELLASHSIRPVGFALVGARGVAKEGYYYTPSRATSAEKRRQRVKEPAA
jgi:capsular exopolysaccharide synthesis family protein